MCTECWFNADEGYCLDCSEEVWCTKPRSKDMQQKFMIQTALFEIKNWTGNISYKEFPTTVILLLSEYARGWVEFCDYCLQEQCVINTQNTYEWFERNLEEQLICEECEFCPDGLDDNFSFVKSSLLNLLYWN